MFNWFTIPLMWGALWLSFAWCTRALRVNRVIICRTEALADSVAYPISMVLWLLADLLIMHSVVAASTVLVIGVFFERERIQWYKRHKDHDDDCEYGPRRRREGGKITLPMWWQPKILWSPA